MNLQTLINLEKSFINGQISLEEVQTQLNLFVEFPPKVDKESDFFLDTTADLISKASVYGEFISKFPTPQFDFENALHDNYFGVLDSFIDIEYNLNETQIKEMVKLMGGLDATYENAKKFFDKETTSVETRLAMYRNLF